MEHSPLQDSLEPQCWLGLALTVAARNQRCGGVHEFDKLFLKPLEVCTTGFQDAHCRFIIQ